MHCWSLCSRDRIAGHGFRHGVVACGWACTNAQLLCCRAEAIVQMLALDATEGKAYAITSTDGNGPGTDPSAWKALLT